MIFLNSRYANGPLATLTDPHTKQAQRMVFRKFTNRTSKYAYYLWREGDRLDLVANTFYGNPDGWWQILDFNPEISDPTSIPPGYALRMPL